MEVQSDGGGGMTWRAFEREVESIYKGPHRSESTRKKMEYVLRKAHELGAERPADLTTAFVSRYVAERAEDVCLNTIRGELRYLKAAVNLAIEEEWIVRGPKWRRVWPRKSRKVRSVLHPIEDVARVLERLRAEATTWEGRRLHALFAVYAYTGVRKREALYLRREDVSLADRVLWVHYQGDHRLKTEDSEGPVPIPRELATILAEWIPTSGSDWVFPGRRGRGPWIGGAYGDRPTERIRLAGEALGIQALTPLSMRTTFATWCRKRWGLTARQLMAILRHTTERTQEAYLPPELSDLVKSVRKVTYFRSPDRKAG